MIVSGLDYQLTFAANLTEAQIAIGQIADTPETAPHVICLDANLSPGNHDGKDGRDLLDMIRKADYKGTVLSISLDPITEKGLNIPRDCDIGKAGLGELPKVLERLNILSTLGIAKP